MIFQRPKTPDGRAPESIYAQRQNDNAAFAATAQSVQGARVNRTTRGLVIIPEPVSSQVSGGNILGPFALYDVYGDYLVCRGYNPTTDEYDAVWKYIAKEPKHRESLTAETILGVDHSYTFADGPEETNWEVGTSSAFNRTRTDDDGTDTEDQRIVPPWRYDEQVYCVRAKVYAESQTEPYWAPMLATKLDEDGAETEDTVTVALLIVGRSCQWAGPVT